MASRESCNCSIESSKLLKQSCTTSSPMLDNLLSLLFRSFDTAEDAPRAAFNATEREMLHNFKGSFSIVKAYGDKDL
ncbi:plant invertase/pectin methylesterase inhibitor superfamily protein [Trifolium repens]|nr:plant invertase/pectin methylesterase inhibitor superfamily protein [Trifolium repens]